MGQGERRLGEENRMTADRFGDTDTQPLLGKPAGKEPEERLELEPLMRRLTGGCQPGKIFIPDRRRDEVLDVIPNDHRVELLVPRGCN